MKRNRDRISSASPSSNLGPSADGTLCIKPRREGGARSKFVFARGRIPLLSSLLGSLFFFSGGALAQTPQAPVPPGEVAPPAAAEEAPTPVEAPQAEGTPEATPGDASETGSSEDQSGEAEPTPASPEASRRAATVVPIAPTASPAPEKPEESDAKEASEKDEKVVPQISGSPGQGLTLVASEAFSLNVKSRIQLRYQLNIPHEEEGTPRELEQLANIGTARLWFSGNLFQPELTYMIQLAVADRDFRDGAKSPIYDAYLDFKHHRDLSFRAGQFFVPFDRLRTVREWALQMADRPRPVAELTLDRDVGVMVYSDRFLGEKSPLAYRLGAFGGGGTNLSTGREPGTLVVGRLELRPLGPIDDDKEGDLDRRTRPGLALGVGAAQNFNTDRLRSTTGPHFVGGTTDYFHAAADLVFKWRGLALQGEYLYKQASEDEINSVDDAGVPLTEATRSGYGWVAQASYAFDPPFEIVGRLSRLYARSGTDPLLIEEVEARGQEVGAGLNYYINAHWMKVQADWIALMPHDFDFGRADHVTHLQLDVTF